MAKLKWYNTRVRGVRYRTHPDRRNGIRPDRYYAIRFQYEGKRVEEALGWESEGWTFEKAISTLYELKEAAKKGTGPTRLSEKRDIARKNRKETELQDRQSIPFDAFFKDHYLPLQGDKSERSLAREKSLFKLWIDPVLGSTGLKDVSQIQLERVKRNMAKAGKAPRSIVYALALIRQIFNTAIRLGYFGGQNPVKTVKKPRFDNRRQRFLAVEEADLLLKELRKRSIQIHNITLISLHCGLRAGEIFDLRWGHLNFDQDFIRVVDTKTHRNRQVYMTDHVKKMLLAYTPGQPDERVFTTFDGKRIDQVSKSFRESVNALGLNDGISDRRDKITFHSCRHSYASWSVMAGVSLYELQRLLGHQSFDMVQRYAHLAPDHIITARDKLEQSLIAANNVEESIA